MAKKKRGRPPGSKTKKRTRPSEAKTPAKKKKGAGKPALSRRMHVLPDLATGRYCIVSVVQPPPPPPEGPPLPATLHFLTASGGFSADLGSIMSYDTKADAQAVLTNLKKEFEGGDPVVDPLINSAEAESFKKYLASSYTINPSTNAVMATLTLKDQAVSFKAAVREARNRMTVTIREAKHEHKLRQQELLAQVEACDEEIDHAEAYLVQFEKQMASYA